MSAFWADNFTDANGTNVSAHTPDVGSTYSYITARTDIRIFSNIAFSKGGTTAALDAVVNAATPPSADYPIDANVFYDSTGGVGDSEPRLIARYDAGTGKYYLAGYSEPAGAWQIYYYDGASFNLLNHFDESMPTADFLMTFSVTGASPATLVLKKDGTTKVSVTDSNISAAGKAGFCLTDSTSVVGLRYGFKDIAAGGSLPLTAGTASITAMTSTTLTLSGTAVAGGTANFTYTAQISTDNSSWSTVGSTQSLAAGVAPSTRQATGLTAGTLYYMRWSVTDSAGSPATVTSNSATAVPHAAGQFYASTSGSDSNNGTSTSTPWQTVTKIQAFLNFLLPGDTLSLKGGDTFTASFRIVAAQGTSGAKCVLNSYGSGLPVISGGDSYGVWLDECKYTELRVLELAGSGVASNGTTTNTDAGVKMTLAGAADLPGLLTTGCTIHGFKRPVYLSVAAAATNSILSPSILLNTIYDGCTAGVELSHDPSPFAAGGVHDLRITTPDLAFNTIYHIYGDGVNNTGYGVVVGNCNGGTVESNYIHDNGGASGTAAGGPVGIMTFESDGVVVKWNEVSNQVSNEIYDGEGIDCDGGSRNCVIEYNYIHGCDGAAWMDFSIGGAFTTNNNNTFRFNVCQNNGRRAHSANGTNPATFVSLFAGSTNTAVYNNTVFDQNATGSETKSIYDNSASGATIRDNIIIIDGSGRTFGTVKSGTALNPNRYYARNGATFSLTYAGTTYTSLASLQAAGQEANGSTGDPALSAIGTAGSGYPLGNFSTLTQYNPTNLTAAAGGLDMQSNFGVDPGPVDFHGNVVPVTGTTTYPIGAVRTGNSGAAAYYYRQMMG